MKRMSLYGKFTLVILVLIAGKISISIFAASEMNGINDSLAHITGSVVPRMSDGFALRDVARRLTIAEAALEADANRDAVEKRVKEIFELSSAFMATWDSAYHGASDKGKERLVAIKELFEKWKDVDQQAQSLALSNQLAAAIAMSNDKGQAYTRSLQAEIIRLIDLNKNNMDEETAQVDLEHTKARGALIMFVATTILFGVAAAFLVMRSLARSINQVIGRLKENTGLLSKAAKRIATSSKELSGSTSEQAEALDRTTGQVREMNETVRKNAESAKMTCELSSVSELAAKKGKDVVAEMIAAIAEINASNQYVMAQIKESNEQISQVVKVVSEIGEKTKVINDIVFQTKLLSFNASVEAARAGEHGKGFAVVADEVRNLADTSGKAAQEIALMLEASIQKVESIVTETNERIVRLATTGDVKVQAGTRVAQQCGKVLDEIVANVSSVNSMARDISAASDDQAHGIENVFETVKKLERSTQESAAVSVEAATVGIDLAEEAEALREIVALLIQTIDGGGAGKASVAEVAPPAPAAAAATEPDNVIVFPPKPDAKRIASGG